MKCVRLNDRQRERNPLVLSVLSFRRKAYTQTEPTETKREKERAREKVRERKGERKRERDRAGERKGERER